MIDIDAIHNLRTRLELKHGTQAHPKRDLLWDFAWDLGHADGLHQVEYFYDELTVFVK